MYYCKLKKNVMTCKRRLKQSRSDKTKAGKTHLQTKLKLKVWSWWCVHHGKVHVWRIRWCCDCCGENSLRALPASVHMCLWICVWVLHVSGPRLQMIAQPPPCSGCQPLLASLITHLTINVQYCSSLIKKLIVHRWGDERAHVVLVLWLCVHFLALASWLSLLPQQDTLILWQVNKDQPLSAYMSHHQMVSPWLANRKWKRLRAEQMKEQSVVTRRYVAVVTALTLSSTELQVRCGV